MGDTGSCSGVNSLQMLSAPNPSCKIDISYGISSFYGNFNNIMSVVSYNRLLFT